MCLKKKSLCSIYFVFLTLVANFETNCTWMVKMHRDRLGFEPGTLLLCLLTDIVYIHVHLLYTVCDFW